MTEGLEVIPKEVTGSLEELQEALKNAYNIQRPVHKYKMNEVLNKQRAKQNKVAK